MRETFIVFDENIREFAEKICENTPNVSGVVAIEATEQNKTIETVLGICRYLMQMEADRNAMLLAVGGGVTTDMVGFAASIYKRGIAYANVPTTLLSQVDAAIGGKTGVNFDSYKNMLGVIRQPEYTEIHPEVLATLPRKQWLSGAAEVLKTFIIADATRYEQAVSLFASIIADGESVEQHAEELKDIIEAAGNVKRSIVEQDPEEHGIRRVLNLGHTYAHAIEWWQSTTDALEEPFSHGEAVAIGMVRAAEISQELGVAEKGLAEKLRLDFKKIGLPTELPCEESVLADAIRKDKKSEDGKVNFVLIRRIGEVTVKKI